MATILKVDEWQSPTGNWYVADIHTWTGWKECADILGARDLDEYMEILRDRYQATIHGTLGPLKHNIMFNWPKEKYRFAHQFKLDINRIARKKGYTVD